jgi:uncharacterized repeat protein (TIGR02543 family)
MKFFKPSAIVPAMAIFFSCLVILPQSLRAQNETLIFSVTGDIPYSSSEETEMQQQIAEHNLYSPSEFFVHIGDIKSGSGSCSESVYQKVKSYLLQLQVPTFITPGDNEWIDCSNPPQAWNYWVQYFMNFEQNFCPVPGFQKQAVRPENFAWVQKGVLLIGISMPGGSEGSTAKARRLQDDADWVAQQFQAHGSEVRAAVIFAHNMDKSADALFINQFITLANSFAKPILYIHGSGHSWKQDNPLSASNVLRVQVDNGGAALPVQVTVTTNNPATFVFNRTPWNSNSQPINRTPCGQSSAPAITVNPSAHDYGQVAVGGNSSQTFVVSNAGNATLEVTNTTLTGGDAADFGIVSGGGSYFLSPGQTRNVVVRFSPASEGGKSTTLRFESNDPDDGTKDVSLDGAGVTTTTMFTLATNVVGGGSISLDPLGGSYEEGTVVTVTAIPASDFVFSGWSGDLAGPNNPMTITMDANKSVTAIFEPSDPGGSGTIVHEETQTGGSTSSASVSTSASLIGVSGHLYLAAISNRSNRSVTSVSGLGLTWTLVKAQCSTRGRLGLEVWKAQGTPSGNGAVTATFSATPDNAAIAVSRYSGVDAINPLGNLISGNLNGVNGTCSGGSESNSYSFNLTTTTNGAMVYGAISMRQETHTPGAGYTERADRMQGSGSNAASVAVEDKSFASAGTAIVNGSFSDAVYWAVVALELKPQSGAGPTQYTLTANTNGSGSVSLNPPGGVYNSGATVELTATPAAGFQFSGWSGSLTGTTNPATITMDGNKSVTATFTAIPPTQYTLTVTTSGSGSVSLNPPGGVYNSGATVELTATPAAGFQFSGWSGNLTGTTNPAAITMDGNKSVTATFTAVGGGGQITYEETQTGSSVGSASVATSTSLTAANGHLYLAAISFKSNVGVSSVSGLGLTWTRVKAQCAGRNQTGVEIWMAQGTPSGNGTVTATLASTPKSAVIAVSRYSGAAAVNPVSNLVSGNTTGVNGACSGGSDNAAYSFNATTTSNGAVIYSVAAMRSHIHTPGAGYTERAEIKSNSGNSDASSVAVQERSVASPAAVVVNGSFESTTDWAMAAVEIKP